MNRGNLEQKKMMVLALIILCTMGGIGVDAYLFFRVQTVSETLSQMSRELANITERSREVTLWEEKLPHFESDLEELKKVFVNANMPVEFVEHMEQTADKSGVEIEISLLSSQKEEEEMFHSVPVKMKVKGSFVDCLRFLDKLEHSPYLVQIQNLSISSTREKTIQFTMMTEVLSYENTD